MEELGSSTIKITNGDSITALLSRSRNPKLIPGGKLQTNQMKTYNDSSELFDFSRLDFLNYDMFREKGREYLLQEMQGKEESIVLGLASLYQFNHREVIDDYNSDKNFNRILGKFFLLETSVVLTDEEAQMTTNIFLRVYEIAVSKMF